MLSTLGVAILLLLDGPFQEKLQTPQEQTGPSRPGTFKAFGKSTLKPPTKKAALAPQLDQDSLEEIRKIRDRIGLRLFPGKKNEREFESQLQKLGKEGSFPKKSIENRRPTLLTNGESRPPLVEPTPRRNVARSLLTLQSLFAAVENLDKEALQLEQTGEFEKSKKLRKLSRRIQKQIQQMVNPRDN